MTRRETAREKMMERRITKAGSGVGLRIVHRRISHAKAIALAAECRHDDPKGRYGYAPSASGKTYNVVELLAK